MGNELEFDRVKSPWGEFIISASEKGLYSLEFPQSKQKKVRIKSKVKKNSPELKKAKRLLEDYFAGRKTDLASICVDLTGYSSFEKKVYTKLKKIPLGKVLSYGELATLAGAPGAYRAVGSTMGKNRIPIILPCHRVLGSTGKLCGFSAGLHWKKRLLALEHAQAE